MKCILLPLSAISYLNYACSLFCSDPRTLNRTEKQAQNSNFSKLNEFLKHKLSGLVFLKDDI